MSWLLGKFESSGYFGPTATSEFTSDVCSTPTCRITPIPLKWTAKLPGSLLGGNFTALPRIPLANLDIPEPKARQHAGKRLACIFVGDLQDAVLQCGCLKLALSFLAYLAFKIRIGRGEQSGVA